jgi:diaminohydroxyphosphoribosylaminopyrimidine deaminase/5-amino-6-(5-phosphoribosylamino)uracil reductase
LVHKWRAEEQAILVGTNTVLEDNPSLTVRNWTGINPTRVVIDRTEKLSKTHTIFNANANTIVLTKDTINFSKPLASEICDALYKNNINSIIIEGGSKTLQTFINENLWDEARIFKGNTVFQKGIKAPKLKGELTKTSQVLNDSLYIYTPQNK